MKIAITILSVLFLAACSSDNGGNFGIGGTKCIGCELPELNSSQKSRLNNFSTELGGVQKATSKHMAKNVGNTFRSMAQSKLSPQSIPNQKGQFYEKEVDDAFQEGFCQITATGLDDIGSSMGSGFGQGFSGPEALPEKIEITIEIANNKSLPGSRCPFTNYLAVTAQSKMQESSTAFSYDLSFSLKNNMALDQSSDLYQAAKVFASRTEMNGQFTVRATQAQQAANFNFSGGGVSVFTSKDDFEGDVTLQYTLTGSAVQGQNSGSGSFEFVMDYQFNDFRVVGAISATVNNLEQEDLPLTYRTNAKQVSEEEFFKYFTLGPAGDVVEKVQNELSVVSQ